MAALGPSEVVLSHRMGTTSSALTVLGPLVLATDVLFLLGGEVICDVECLTDLLRRLALDHVRDRLTTDVKERLNIEVVRSL